MSDDYKYYMCRQNKRMVTWEEEVSLEEYFEGLKYISCDGLSSKGKPKNIYTETYAETTEPRVFIPKDVARETTDIEFEFAFLGKSRRDIYDSFCDWITGYRLKYWDTCREREVEMLLLEALKPSEDKLYGSTPYITAKFKFKNLLGNSKKKEQA